MLAGVLILTSACSSDPNAPAVRSPLIPLSVGTEWRYERTDSVEVGPPTELPALHFTVRVIDDTTIGRERWAVVDNAKLLLHDILEGRSYLRNRPDGLYEHTRTELFPVGFDLAFQIFKYPAKRDEQSTAFPPSIVSATDTLIRVPAGDFRTIRYDVGDYTTYFVAPGIGVVKKVTGLAEERDGSGRLVGRWRLVYELDRFGSAS